MRKTEQTPDLTRHMLAELGRNLVRELTEWEEDFVSSIRKQFERKGELSPRQFEILEQIYAEKTA